jgi:hypothetical protein
MYIEYLQGNPVNKEDIKGYKALCQKDIEPTLTLLVSYQYTRVAGTWHVHVMCLATSTKREKNKENKGRKKGKTKQEKQGIKQLTIIFLQTN